MDEGEKSHMFVLSGEVVFFLSLASFRAATNNWSLSPVCILSHCGVPRNGVSTLSLYGNYRGSTRMMLAHHQIPKIGKQRSYLRLTLRPLPFHLPV